MPDHQFGFRRVVQHWKISSTALPSFWISSRHLIAYGLLFKLKSLLPSAQYLLLRSYLLDRSFMVEVRGERSTIRRIRAGVPQGSVFGPALYTLYTADLPIPVARNTLLATYANDTVFLANSTTAWRAAAVTQRFLDDFSTWANRWNICVNGSKSQHCTFALRNGNCPTVRLNNMVIPQENHVRYLDAIGREGQEDQDCCESGTACSQMPNGGSRWIAMRGGKSTADPEMPAQCSSVKTSHQWCATFRAEAMQSKPGRGNMSRMHKAAAADPDSGAQQEQSTAVTVSLEHKSTK
ncbi:GH23611 [Drosophila grimshawi]|uniref:GH23611 n=1 Tax=Drosophila grimshawi TaxID=7222 RepID=B4K0P0_DROGR|nr:GH23611 [Drosophila grimshawi]